MTYVLDVLFLVYSLLEKVGETEREGESISDYFHGPGGVAPGLDELFSTSACGTPQITNIYWPHS